ncbi:MAG: CPBP family intramembrane glutamic endopeptidase [PVC group bacterium]
MKNKSALQVCFRKLKEERAVAGAVLLAAALILTAGPLPEGPAARDSSPDWSRLSRAIGLEDAPPVPAIMFRLLTVVFLTLAASGLVLNVQGLLGRDWRFFSPGPPPEAGWGIWPVAKVAVYFICLLLLFQRLEALVVDFAGFPRARVYQLRLLGNAFFQFSLLIVLVLYFLEKFRAATPVSPPGGAERMTAGAAHPEAARRTVLPPARLPGPASMDWKGSARQAVRGYILFFPALVALILISLGVTRALGVPFQPHPLVQPLLEAGETSFIWPLFAIGIFLGPLAEELFFRGLLFPALKQRMSVFWSAILTAAVFSTLHLNWAGWLPIFGLGILLAGSYQKTGSILVPIFIHVIHNGLFLTFTVLVFELSN